MPPVFRIHCWLHFLEEIPQDFNWNQQPTGEFIGIFFKFVFSPIVLVEPIERISGRGNAFIFKLISVEEKMPQLMRN